MLLIGVTIVLPIIFPLLIVLMLKASPAFRGKVSFLRVIQDGQLSWVALGLAFTSMYKVLVTQNASTLTPDYRLGAVVILAILALISGLVAAIGAVAPSTGHESQLAKHWYQKYAVLNMSVVLVFLTALVYASVSPLAAS